jgi:hypothetical protein
MPDNPNLKIAYYLAWCGTEATHQFEGQAQYDAACAFLNTIAKAHLRGDTLPSAYARKVSDYYVIEKGHRQAFEFHAEDRDRIIVRPALALGYYRAELWCEGRAKGKGALIFLDSRHCRP